MNDSFRPERTALFVTVVLVVGALVAPFAIEGLSLRWGRGAGRQVVTLTGLAEQGIWTEDEIYAAGATETARPAEPRLEVGRPVLLRLKSADVVHTFSCPDFGIGQTEVAPGKVVEIPFVPEREGAVEYFCTVVCGESHFRMRGWFLVGAEATAPIPAQYEEYWRIPPPAQPDSIARGKWLFRRSGCFTCHGDDGRGGVRNPNYINETVPALNTLAARRLFLQPAEAARLAELLNEGARLEDLKREPPFPRFDAVTSQYAIVRDVIRLGTMAGKKEIDGPQPPLQMPAWGQRLEGRDIDDLLIYLLSLNGQPAPETG